MLDHTAVVATGVDLGTQSKHALNRTKQRCCSVEWGLLVHRVHELVC